MMSLNAPTVRGWKVFRAAIIVALALLGAVVSSAPSQSYHYEEIYAFSGDTNGYGPKGALAQRTDGNLYGTTYQGAQPTINCPACGYGTVFRIMPEGALTTLAWFHGRAGLTNGEGITNYGGYPFGSMVQASDGNLYGSSEYGGFRVTPGGVLTSGPGGGDGGDPIQGTNGYIYGVDSYYGLVAWASLDDTYYREVSVPGAPSGGLVQASDGNFYGLTSDGVAGGGAYGFGTAYKLTPGGVLTTLVSFGGTNTGRFRGQLKVLT